MSYIFDKERRKMNIGYQADLRQTTQSSLTGTITKRYRCKRAESGRWPPTPPPTPGPSPNLPMI
jgi:hypothetical protein